MIQHDAEFWRGLLVKYMRAVIDRESIMYLDPRDRGDDEFSPLKVKLTDKEWNAIDTVDDQARAENEAHDKAIRDAADEDIARATREQAANTG